MASSKKNTPGDRPSRRRKKPAAESLRFEAPGPQTGDSLRVIIRSGPSGEAIIDTVLSDSRSASRSEDKAPQIPASESIRDHRRKQFEQRVLPIALLARRYAMDAKLIADHGTQADMRQAILLMTKNLDGLVDTILRVCVDITSP